MNWFITSITFEGFLSFMNWFNMSSQVFLLRKASITIFAFEGLYSFMNWFNMPIQMSFLRKTCITKITLEYLLSLLTDSAYEFRDCFWKKPSSISVFSVILWTLVNVWAGTKTFIHMRLFISLTIYPETLLCHALLIKRMKWQNSFFPS